MRWCLWQVLGIELCQLVCVGFCCDVVFVTNSNTELKGGKQLHLLKLTAKHTGVEVK